MTPVISFCVLCSLLAAGKLLRVRVKCIRNLYLPASVVGGILGLVLLQVVGESAPAEWTAGWSKLPGLLINIVFATLFLGVKIPPLSTVWKRSAPQLAYGQIVAWGQYVVGLGLVLLVLGPVFNVPDMFGIIVPVGFEGGHGTAGGLGPTFSELGWADGLDYGLASATAGIVSAIIVGMALINWAIRSGIVKGGGTLAGAGGNDRTGMYPPECRPSAGAQTTSPGSVDTLALHIAFVGIAVLLGVILKTGLAKAEAHLLGTSENTIRISEVIADETIRNNVYRMLGRLLNPEVFRKLKGLEKALSESENQGSVGWNGTV